MKRSKVFGMFKRSQRLVMHGFALFGVLTLALLLLTDYGWQASTMVAPVAAAPDIENATVAKTDSKQVALKVDVRQQKLASYLARRYRVANDVVQEMVGEAYSVGRHAGIDPLLILAVVSVESRFNPIAESSFGAKGLMQVVPRFHLDKLARLGGEDAVLHPHTNIQLGTLILKDYIRKTGNTESALQMYAGATDDENLSYSQKVLVERNRLYQVLGRTAPVSTPAPVIASAKHTDA